MGRSHALLQVPEHLAVDAEMHLFDIVTQFAIGEVQIPSEPVKQTNVYLGMVPHQHGNAVDRLSSWDIVYTILRIHPQSSKSLDHHHQHID